MDVADERHRLERNEIEIMVIKRREKFEVNIGGLEEEIKEIKEGSGWGDLHLYKKHIEAINEYQAQIEQYEEEMNEIS